jgi:hypothetical protein
MRHFCLLSYDRRHRKERRNTMTQEVHGRSYGGTPAENYQRFFVPSIGGPVADDLMLLPIFERANACSMSRAAPES